MSESATWVKACLSPVVPGTKVHAMALTPLILWTVWFSWLTFALTLAVAAMFFALEIKGRRPGWVTARQRSRLRSQKVAAMPYWYLRRRNRLQSYSDMDLKRAWDVEEATAQAQGLSLRVNRPGAAGPGGLKSRDR
jgi:hypothetical protein